MSRLAPVLLGWYFVVSYGSVTKLDFATQIACEAARSDVLAQIGTSNKSRVSPRCREDVTPPLSLTIDGTLTFDGTVTPGVTP